MADFLLMTTTYLFFFWPGSKEELEDLQTAYVEFRGDMTEILNNVMCSTIEDEPRFTKIIKGWIKKKTVPDFPAFSKENKKSKEKRKREVRDVWEPYLSISFLPWMVGC